MSAVSQSADSFGAGASSIWAPPCAGRPYALVTYATPSRSTARAAPPLWPASRITHPPFRQSRFPIARFLIVPRWRRRPCGRFSSSRSAATLLDAAKVLSAADGDFARVRTYLETGKGSLASVPIVAVPTTAGTGSEVTCWATVWTGRAPQVFADAREALSRTRPHRSSADLGHAARAVASGLDALRTRSSASGT
jgi:alcohol dehydrogenase